MDQKVVSGLERKIEEALTKACARKGRGRLPLPPSQQTMHLMAKAAVSVYEAAVEAHAESGWRSYRPV